MPSKNKFMNSLLESYSFFYKNKSFMLVPFFSDIVFFVVFAFVFTLFQLRIVEHMMNLNQIISESTMALESGQTAEALNMIAEKGVFFQEYRAMLVLMVSVLLITFVLWCLFQGFSWNFTHRVMKKKEKFLKYLAKFSLLSFFFALILFIIIELLIKFSSGKNFLTGFLLNEAFFKLIIPILFLVFLYFALISYTTIPKNSYLQLFKRTFYLSIKKIHYFLPVFLLIAVKFFIIIKMLYLLFYLSTALSYIAGFVLSPGLFAWSRVLLIKMEEKVK